MADSRAASPSDRALLATLLAGIAREERGALERLYSCTSAKLFGVCLRILDDEAQAEDALQDTFLTIWRRADTFDVARGTAMTWLMTVARNAAIDRRRRMTRVAEAPLPFPVDVPDPAPDPLTDALSVEERRRLRDCLDGLDARDRQFVAGSFLEGSSYPELAERAAMPLPTLKSRIRRALLRLRECMA